MNFVALATIAFLLFAIGASLQEQLDRIATALERQMAICADHQHRTESEEQQ